MDRVHDVFLQFIAAPRNVGPIASDVCAAVGETPRGPVDTAVWAGSPTEFKKYFGGMTPSPTDPTIPLSGYPSFLGLALEGVGKKLFVRVVGSLATTGYVTISNATGDMFTLHAATLGDYSPGPWATSLSVNVAANINPDLFDLTVTNAATGEQDSFTGLDFSDNQALINTINAKATLVLATQPVIDAFTAAPTGTPTEGTGTLQAGDYRFVVTGVTAGNKETGVSPEVKVTLNADGEIAVSVPSLPTGIDHINVYGTSKDGASGTEYFWGQGNSGATAVTFSAPVTASTKYPPHKNTALKGAGDNTAVATTGTTNFPSSGTTAGQCVGTNGPAASSARYLGAAGTPATGVFCLAGLDPAVNFVTLAEDAGADVTTWAAQAQAAADNGWIAVVTFPRGTSDTEAISTFAEQTALLGSYTAQYIKAAWNWIDIQDNEYYNGPLLVSPASHFAAISAVQLANTSAASKPLANIIGAQYQINRSQLNSLIGSNINAVTSLIPVKGVGFGSDLHMSGDDGYLVRMKLLIAAGLEKLGGQFVDQPNTPNLWQKCRDTLMAFFDGLAAQGLIPANPAGVDTSTQAAQSTATASTKGTGLAAGNNPTTGSVLSSQANYNVVCDDSNNLFNGLPTKTLYADAQCRIAPNVDAALFRAEVGDTVQVSSAVS